VVQLLEVRVVYSSLLRGYGLKRLAVNIQCYYLKTYLSVGLRDGQGNFQLEESVWQKFLSSGPQQLLGQEVMKRDVIVRSHNV
jgi:hypothetical protein